MEAVMIPYDLLGTRWQVGVSGGTSAFSLEDYNPAGCVYGHVALPISVLPQVIEALQTLAQEVANGH